MEKEHLEMLLEDINEKLDLVLEGQASLNRKIDSFHESLSEKIELNSSMIGALNQKIDNVDEKLTKEINRVEKKVDALASDLAAHRADTESHPKGYKVSDNRK